MAQASTSTLHRTTHPAQNLSHLLHTPPTSKAATSSFFSRFCGIFSPGREHGLLHPPDRAPPPALVVAHDASADDGEGEGADLYFGRVFRYFDEDGDGKISPSELRSCMRTVGEELSEEEAEAVVESTDSDGDGLLGFEDFVRLVKVEGEEERTRDLREAFVMYAAAEGVAPGDDHGCGCITPKSLRRMLARLGEWKSLEECRVMIRRFDLNGDGVLSFDEFRVMML